MTSVNSRRTVLKRSFLLGLAAVSSGLPLRLAKAAKSAVYTPRRSNLAVGGYDSVAYFTQSKPVKGVKMYSVNHLGAQWYFAGAENLAAFNSDPAAYMPQYGGYCAFSVAQGKLVKGDPRLWAIENDRLYFNYNKGIHRLWLSRVASLVNSADKNWPTILG